jgi:hypothetical protein
MATRSPKDGAWAEKSCIVLPLRSWNLIIRLRCDDASHGGAHRSGAYSAKYSFCSRGSCSRPVGTEDLRQPVTGSEVSRPMPVVIYGVDEFEFRQTSQ